MLLDLSGSWRIRLDRKEEGIKQQWEEDRFAESSRITLPGILQSQGYGDEISVDTPWVSGLHDPFWYKREAYQCAQEETCQVPFLAQPPKHYTGKAWYQREIEIPKDSSHALTLWIELTHWTSRVWVDDIYKGSDFSLCTAHRIPLGVLSPGIHRLTVCIDNSFQYPYRPDGHGVSDALAATWNGMAGEIVLLSSDELTKRQQADAEFAIRHPRKIEVSDGMFYVDGKPEYFRGTHYGGEYPLTGYPSTDPVWWQKLMNTVREWGLNFIRCHSYCPPKAAFEAADEAGVYLQVECGMWNVFCEEIPMLDILRKETRRILTQFGHHPSFVLFSPTNEPSGSWYEPLKRWGTETREYDESLGYGSRRVYTAQSGWFYDTAPRDITGTDYLYFHRSAYGPILGGNIRNYEGWNGKDYAPSLEGSKLPAICHELGQWCAYPDFDIIDKFTGYMRPGNYQVFKANAKRAGVLVHNQEFALESGKNQVLMYKEELEANFRTPHLYGYELLDLHDYLGQGTALVGVLDAFWDNKGYVEAPAWRRFCAETVLLARIPGYVCKNTDRLEIPIEICHFGEKPIDGAILFWSLKEGENRLFCGELPKTDIPLGKNIPLGSVTLDFSEIHKDSKLNFEVRIGAICNDWDLYVFAKQNDGEPIVSEEMPETVYTKDWQKAKLLLQQKKNVVFSPHLSTLDYTCPPLSMRPVFWNAQMGPNWSRQVGMVCEASHPLFQSFKTDRHGGWQWEDILAHARGFHMEGMAEFPGAIVSPIDDWNRNLPLTLMMECRMFGGNLFFVSADLEGSFTERPAAYRLKKAILNYVSSTEFHPEGELKPEQIERHMRPNQIMKALGTAVLLEPGVIVHQEGALLDGNPNTSLEVTALQYPITLEICLKEKTTISGLTYMANQKDRLHAGDVRTYSVMTEIDGLWSESACGELLSSYAPQDIWLDQTVRTDHLKFIARSGFLPAEETVWEEQRDGWRPVVHKAKVQVKIAILNVITDDIIPENDTVYWNKAVKSTTKEIDD